MERGRLIILHLASDRDSQSKKNQPLPSIYVYGGRNTRSYEN